MRALVPTYDDTGIAMSARVQREEWLKERARKHQFHSHTETQKHRNTKKKVRKGKNGCWCKSQSKQLKPTHVWVGKSGVVLEVEPGLEQGACSQELVISLFELTWTAPSHLRAVTQAEGGGAELLTY